MREKAGWRCFFWVTSCTWLVVGACEPMIAPAAQSVIDAGPRDAQDGGPLDGLLDPPPVDGAPDGGAPWDGGSAPARSCRDPGRPTDRSVIRLQPVFESELSAELGDTLVELVQTSSGPERWYAAQRRGRVLTFTPGETASTALDLSSLLRLDHPELGVMSIALAPSFPLVPWLYVSYTAPSDRGGNHLGRISRFPLRDDGTSFELAAEEIILEVVQPAPSHNLNQISFGVDGFLYAAIGDGGNPNDRYGNGQNPSTLMGTIVRIDPSTPDTARALPYSIPSDNPFVDEDGFAPEIWAWGLRNPWRLSHDRETGQIWAGDVGQDTWEELNRIERGANYGWPRKEGADCFLDASCDTGTPLTDPVWSFSHAEGKSITAGFAYRGSALSSLQGHVFVADFMGGAIWTVNPMSPHAVATLQVESARNISTFAEDREGELYVVHYAGEGRGRVYRIEPALPAVADAFPRTLSETGCVDVANPFAPIEPAIPYAPAAELWSDGAEKSRSFVVPSGERIEIGADGDFLLPTGSVVVKHFGFGGIPHETRLYIHHVDGWAGYSYRWRADGTDADLLETGRVETLPNGIRWVYPNRRQCVECHTEEAGITLGIEALQLGVPVADAPAGTPDQLTQLLARPELFHDEGASLLQAFLDDQRTMPRPYDEDANPTEAARAYLHANCAGCHRAGAPTARGAADFRYSVARADMQVCNTQPEHGRLYLPDSAALRLLVPGRPDQSILWLRMATTNVFRMPPLGSSIPDARALDLIGAWIEGMASCDNAE